MHNPNSQLLLTHIQPSDRSAAWSSRVHQSSSKKNSVIRRAVSVFSVRRFFKKKKKRYIELESVYYRQFYRVLSIHLSIYSVLRNNRNNRGRSRANKPPRPLFFLFSFCNFFPPLVGGPFERRLPFPNTARAFWNVIFATRRKNVRALIPRATPTAVSVRPCYLDTYRPISTSVKTKTNNSWLNIIYTTSCPDPVGHTESNFNSLFSL